MAGGRGGRGAPAPGGARSFQAALVCGDLPAQGMVQAYVALRCTCAIFLRAPRLLRGGQADVPGGYAHPLIPPPTPHPPQHTQARKQMILEEERRLLLREAAELKDYLPRGVLRDQGDLDYINSVLQGTQL